MKDVLLFAALGLGAGSAYALIAQGLLLVHRATGVVNFAQGGIAMISAYSYVWLTNNDGFSPVAATLVVVPLAGVLGALVQWLVMRPLGRAPLLAKLVAVLGVVLVLEAAGTLIFGDQLQAVPSLLPTSSIDLFGVHFGRDLLILLLIALALAAALSLFARRSTLGSLVRAASDSEAGIAILGYSLNAIATSTWVAGSMLAGFAGILIAPITSLSVDGIILLIIPALAVTLLAGFTSFWVATGAGLVLGILQSELAGYWTLNSPTTQGMQEAIPFLLIIGVMVVRGRPIPGHSALTLGRPPLAPPARGNPVVLAGVLAVTVALTAVASNSYQTAIATGLISAIVALSLVVLTGYAGQISLAQMTFAGLGAYCCSRLATNLGLPFPLAVVVSGIAMVPCGLLLGAPALRVRGVNLAVVTLGAAVAVDSLIFNDSSLTGGVNGISIPSPSIFGYSLDGFIHPFRFAMTVLVVLVLCIAAVAWLRRSPLGLKMLAIRDNERAAAAEGVNVMRTKLIAFGIAAFLAGVAGALFGYLYGDVSFDSFSPIASVTFVTIAYIGGIGSIPGAVIAGLISAGGPVFNLLSSNASVNSYQTLIGGLGVVLTAILNPDGIAPAFNADFHRLMRRLADRRPDLAPRAAPDRPLALDKSGGPAAAGERPAAARATVRRGPGNSARSPGRALLAARDIRVAFGEVSVVNGVDLTVTDGVLTGLIGPNGAGKTTLIDAICGFVPSTGTVRLGDGDLHHLRAHERAKRGLRRTFQRTELFEDLTIRENLMVPQQVAARGAKDERFSVEAILDLVGLAGRGGCYPRELSTGEAKLAGLARALRGEPQVLLLDEPAAGLDSAESRVLGERLLRMLDMGVSMLLVDHDLELVMGVCSEVVVLDQGRVLAAGAPAAVRRDPQVRRAYIGTSDQDVVAPPRPVDVAAAPEGLRP